MAVSVAFYEFAKGEVSVIDVPTMPKYTTPQLTYNCFKCLYAAIIFLLFMVIVEKYGVLRGLLVDANAETFGFLPEGTDIIAVSIGAIALVLIFHYVRLPNSEFGPSWFLLRLRTALHNRARIPVEAQILADRIFSDNPSIFSVPLTRFNAMKERLAKQDVTAADFSSNRETIDYQWAVVSYLYLIGEDFKTKTPYSSFVRNEPSMWPEIEREYRDLKPNVRSIKIGGTNQEFQNTLREKLSSLRKKLSAFHACAHLFAINDDAERTAVLRKIGVLGFASRRSFFIIDRSEVAKFSAFIFLGIALPPLAFGGYGLAAEDETFRVFAKPGVIAQWVGYGLPMYFLPILMVLLLKRNMALLWPIRVVKDGDDNDPSARNAKQFKYEVYILIFILSFVIASAPLLVYEILEGPVSLYFALTPAATAVCLAVLIDMDVVDGKQSPAPSRVRHWVDRGMRGILFAAVLGGLFSWLLGSLNPDIPTSQFVIYAVTAACMGLSIGSFSKFDDGDNVRVVDNAVE
ncbi:MAG: hypothetical protein ACFE0S_08375 [Rhodospirillales bacterium]